MDTVLLAGVDSQGNPVLLQLNADGTLSGAGGGAPTGAAGGGLTGTYPNPELADHEHAGVVGDGGTFALRNISARKLTSIVNNTNKTTTSTTMVPIDATNLAYLTLDCAVGDLIHGRLTGTISQSAGNVGGFDMGVDQPISADTRAYPNADFGAAAFQHIVRTPLSISFYFICTEAGVHGFRPLWNVSAGTLTLSSGAGGDDTQITWLVENLGPVTV